MIPAMFSQLTLGVSLKDDATFANFYSGKNQQLILEIKQMAAGLGENFIYIYAQGEGCSHLLQAACHEANRQGLRSVYIPLNEVIHLSPSLLDALETLDLVCIDDLQQLSGKKEWEEAFFYLFNRMRDAGKKLIVSGCSAPKSLGLTLPDVVSRLISGMVFSIQSLTEEEKIFVLKNRASKRGMILSEEVCRFILKNCSRTMKNLFVVLDTLDKTSLAAQRKLTIPFVKDALCK